jgi:hypothetical protein
MSQPPVDDPRPFPSRLTWLAVLGVGVPIGTGVIGLVVAYNDDGSTPSWAIAVSGVALSLLILVSVLLARPLSDRLGRFTTTLVLSLLWGLSFGVLAGVSGTTRVEVASFGLSGFLIPVVFALFVLPLWWLARTVRWSFHKWRARHPRRPRTWYETLGVDQSATPAQVRSARKSAHAQARRAGDEARLAAIDEAWGVLSDPDLRAAYDVKLAARPSARLRRRTSRREVLDTSPAPTVRN